MKKIIALCIILLILCGAAAGGIWYFFFRESDDMRIRKEFSGLVELARKAPGQQSIFDQMQQAKQASKKFTEITTIDLPGYRTAKMTREHIVSNTLMLKKYMIFMQITLYDMTLKFNKKHTECFAEFTIMATGRSMSGNNIREVKEMEAELVKKDGQWLISRLAFRNVLER